MQRETHPFGIRLLGFGPDEADRMADMLALAPSNGPAYARLHGDSLQDPDLFLVNADDLGALAALDGAGPLQPALMVGEPSTEVQYPWVKWPVDPAELFPALARLVDQRADAIADLVARGLPTTVDRRRRQRPDFDLTDPEEYVAMRKEPPKGAVLIVDRNSVFRDHLAKLMAAHHLSIEWTDSASTTMRVCEETPVAMVLINTSTPNIEPYGLCAGIKALDGGRRICVVHLVRKDHVYESDKARAAGVRGMLDLPISERHLTAVLKRILSLPA
jgi:CheY-like chemotaxis protein